MKIKTLYVCQNCGAQAPRWLGRCPSCESWNSYVEENAAVSSVENKSGIVYKDEPVLLTEVSAHNEHRLQSGITEFDRVMGGGIVPGSVTLIGGDPGIGKSTLSMQISCSLAQDGSRVLYVSGEESLKQTKMRADRIILAPERLSLQTGDARHSGQDSALRGSTKKAGDALYIVSQIDVNMIIDHINELNPNVVIVD